MDYEAIATAPQSDSELYEQLFAELRRAMTVEVSERIAILTELFGQMASRPPYRALLDIPEFRTQAMDKAYSLLAEISAMPASSDLRESRLRDDFRRVLAGFIAESRTVEIARRG